MYSDISPAIGSNYYRIKQVDIDGKAMYSVIAAVSNNCIGNYILSYPNPVKDGLTILLPLAMSKANIRISNPIGQVIYLEPASVNGNKVPAANPAKGVYILQVLYQNSVILKQIIIKE